MYQRTISRGAQGQKDQKGFGKQAAMRKRHLLEIEAKYDGATHQEEEEQQCHWFHNLRQALNFLPCSQVCGLLWYAGATGKVHSGQKVGQSFNCPNKQGFF